MALSCHRNQSLKSKCLSQLAASLSRETRSSIAPSYLEGQSGRSFSELGDDSSGAADRLMLVGHFIYGVLVSEFHLRDVGFHTAQHTYAQLAHFLDRITSTQERPSELPTVEIKPKTLEEMIALAPSHALANISAKLFDSTTGQGITHRHAEAILAAVRACSGGATWSRGVCAGRAGGALCRGSLTPAWRAPPADHAATLPLSHRLALKLEGVVLPAVPLSKRQPQRQVKGVQITVTATPHPRTNEKTVELTNIPPALTAVQTVTPVRDFFSAQQLVSVNAPGLYTVAVEAAFVDEKGELWNTGPRTSIVIKAHEEPSAKSIVQATRSRF
ncbi:hypothetical protein evm_007758 [Chilo suppressalis]|nr:hypothetical protein evm_007758 [Chilo suppressalis]